jgi:hypothetical protein
MSKRNYPEFELQKKFCKYINLKHPNILFSSDTIANLSLTKQQQGRNKAIQKEGFHCPDVIFFEPVDNFHGLFIELKVVTPYKKDGTLKKNEHLENQWKTIVALRKRGYSANFATGFDEAVEQLERYLKGL